MRIAIIGAGAMGASIARLALDAGHEAAFAAHGRLHGLRRPGRSARAMPLRDAVRGSDLVVLAVYYKVALALTGDPAVSA